MTEEEFDELRRSAFAIAYRMLGSVSEAEDVVEVSAGNEPEKQKTPPQRGIPRARATGLEPATSGVTGRRSNQLSYAR